MRTDWNWLPIASVSAIIAIASVAMILCWPKMKVRTRNRVKWAIGIGFILILIVLALLTFADTFTAEPTKQCAPNILKAKLPMWLACAMTTYQDLSAGLLAAAGALFAAWLAFQAVQEQIAEAAVSSERQLRAYVLIDYARFDQPEGQGEAESFWPLIVTLKNYGQTPALNLTVQICSEMDVQAATERILEIPDTARTFPSVPLAPSHISTVRFGGIEGRATWLRLAAAGRAGYIWGRVDYADVFGRPHFVTFQMECRFADGAANFCFLEHGNSTDDELPDRL
jgi:hypothetical protein